MTPHIAVVASKTMEARREWSGVYLTNEREELSTKMLHLGKISFKKEN